MGLEQASEWVTRRQDLRVLDWPNLDRVYSAAEGHATGYELVPLQAARRMTCWPTSSR
jgi:hypothetical protein